MVAKLWWRYALTTNKNFEPITTYLYGDVINVDKKNSTITIYDDPKYTHFEEPDDTKYVVYVKNKQILEEIAECISRYEGFFEHYRFTVEAKQDVDSGELEDLKLICFKYDV
jgi:hypothetical protein